ncbi:hypothetical protein [Hahella ganghwensis]|uniref:hypothetical protein n=1 Tax=Hahella ganghwensis TaxID=286420 RepID=UPI000369A028|nr:hypothetical protein [Hahella ganghwensis]
MAKPTGSDNETIEQVRERLRKYARKTMDGFFKPLTDDDWDERGMASGSEDLLGKSDAEFFPGELEEYTSEERKPRLVHSKKK